MENLNFMKIQFNELLKNAKKEIEKAFTKENINTALNILTKAAKTAEEEINDFFDEIKFTTEQLMKMNVLPTEIKKAPKPLPKISQQAKKAPKPLPKITQQRTQRPKPLPKIVKTEVEGDKEIKIIRKIINSDSKAERLIQYNKLKRQCGGNRVVIKFIMDSGLEHHYTFSRDFLRRVEKLISGEKKTETPGSDTELYDIFLNDGIYDIKVSYLEAGLRDKGAFLPFYHNMDEEDLRIIQIRRNAYDKIGVYHSKSMKSDEELKKIKDEEAKRDTVFLKEMGLEIDEDYEDNSIPKEKVIKPVKNWGSVERANKIADHCLVHSLKVLGCPEDNVELVKKYIGKRSFRTKDLTPLSNKLKCKFKLTVISHDDKSGQSKKFGDQKMETEYHLVLYQGHYMPNIEFKMTQYSVRNYEQVKKFANWRNIKYIQKKDGKNIPQRIKEPVIDTIKLIAAMDDSKRFYWDESIHENTEFRHDFSTSKLTPTIIASCQRRMEPIVKNDVETEYIFGADFESIVNKVSVHKAFLLGCVSLDGKYKRVFKATKENLDENKIFTDMLSNLISVYGGKIEKETNDERVKKDIYRKIVNKIHKELVKWELFKSQNDEIIKTANDSVKQDLEEKNKKVEVITTNLHNEINEIYANEFDREKGRTAKPKFIIYFHNLKYDYSLIQACQNFIISSECSKSGNIYSATLKYKGHTFELRDSYKMISMPLRDFQQALGLKNGKKDFAIYEYFTPDNFTNEVASLEELQKHDPKLTEKKIVKRDLERFLTDDKKSISVIDFYVDYMMADCETMIEGLKKFNELMTAQIGLNSFNFLTISSIAHCYFVNNCYTDVCERTFNSHGDVVKCDMYEDAVYEVAGTLREFIARANVGGRTCLQNNKKQNRTVPGMNEFIANVEKLKNDKDGEIKKEITDFRSKTKKIQDFDGVSLYPSAMAISTIPAGFCQELNENTLRELEKNPNLLDHYVVEVLLEVEGEQQIPFLCGEDEDGTRDWTNSVKGSIVMNKIDLVNLPKYYTIKKLEIIQGVYWLGKLRQKISVQEHIKKLFDARAKAKSEKNDGLQNMLKLFMNSAYGKTNVKAAKSNIRYISRKDVPAFRRNNYEYIKCMTFLNDSGSEFDRVRVKLSNNTYEHFNLAHIAGVYLSNSKVIMNDLLNVFTLEGKEALYTDTDSIHMFDEDIPVIAKKYKEIYGRELIGKSLGQFHDDFEPIIPKFNNGVKIPKKERKAYPQYSIGFIGLGKKSYLDVLANDFNDDINYHIRFKGANSANILSYCKTQKITIVEFYEKLFNGDKVRLNLCAGKTRFDYDKKGRVFTKKEFYRCFDFLTKEEKAAKKSLKTRPRQ